MVLSLRATRPRLTVFTAQRPTALQTAPMSARRWPAPTPSLVVLDPHLNPRRLDRFQIVDAVGSQSATTLT